MPQYFDFAHNNLPPAPWATNIVAGWFTDKMIRRDKDDHVIQVFVQGQWYLLSCDLAEKVAQAIAQHPRYGQQGYLEQHEDRDVSSAVLLGADKYLHAIFVSDEDRFWRHRVNSG